jgi:hypothetical protein
MIALGAALAIALLMLITEGWSFLPQGYAREFWQAIFAH